MLMGALFANLEVEYSIRAPACRGNQDGEGGKRCLGSSKPGIWEAGTPVGDRNCDSGAPPAVCCSQVEDLETSPRCSAGEGTGEGSILPK